MRRDPPNGRARADIRPSPAAEERGPPDGYAFGAVSVALPRPMSGATAALGDGSAIVAGATDVARIADGQAANVQPIGGTGVQWCDTNLSWSFAPTPSSHAFVLKSDGVALSVGRMGP